MIYLDRLLALNAVVNYLLLSAAARLSGESAPQLRRMLAAGVGALYALMVLLPRFHSLTTLAIKLLCAAAMVGVAFGLTRRLLRQWLLLLALSALYGGVILALETLLGQSVTVLHGVAYYPVNGTVMALTAGILWLLFATVFARMGAHSGGELVPVVLTLAGQTITFRALRDTGNSLCDPLRGDSVLVVEWPTLRQAIAQAPATLPDDAVAAMELLHRCCPTLRLQLLPYKTVGKTGLLLAVRCSRIEIDGRGQTGALAAISVNRVSDGGAYHALTGGM